MKSLENFSLIDFYILKRANLSVQREVFQESGFDQVSFDRKVLQTSEVPQIEGVDVRVSLDVKSHLVGCITVQSSNSPLCIPRGLLCCLSF